MHSIKQSRQAAIAAALIIALALQSTPVAGQDGGQPQPAQQNTTAPAQEPPAGELLVKTYRSPCDGARIAYGLWLPAGYDESKRWPLIVFLHGSGEGRHWRSPTGVNASVPVLGNRSDIPFVVVFPLMRGSWSISSLAERDVLDTIDEVEKQYSIDEDRVHLTGLSLGGFAAFRIACRYPHLFASVTPFCGGGETDLAANLRDVAVRIYHGAKDVTVLPKHSREMAAALRDARIKADYRELPQSKHVCWRGPYASEELYQYLLGVRRDPSPTRISYRTYDLRYPRAYWATIQERIEPADPAFIDVFIAPDGRSVLVHAENVAILELLPPAGKLAAGKTPRFIINNKTVAAAQYDERYVLRLAARKAEATGDASEPAPAKPATDPVMRKKSACFDGPLQDVMNDAFLIVPPAGTAPAPENNAAGDATDAWSAAVKIAFQRFDRLVYWRAPIVAADKLSPQQVQSHHLICVGTRQNNALIRDATLRVPLSSDGQHLFFENKRLDDSLVAFILLQPSPVADGRYLVVASGHPDAVGRLTAQALTPPFLNPSPREDLLIMKRDGTLLAFPSTPPAQPEPSDRTDMARRLPPRGPLLTNAWRLRAEDQAFLRTLIVEENGQMGEQQGHSPP